MSLRDFPLTLSAGLPQRLDVAGDFFAIIEATDDVYISIDDGPWLKRAQGLGQGEETFRELNVKSLVAQDVRLVAGYGRVYDNREVLTVNVSATVEPSDIITPQTDVSIPAASSYLICAANSNRKSLMLKSNFSNDPADILRLGDSTVSGTKGIELVAGEGVTLATQAAVYGYNTGSSAVTISIIELETT